MFQDKGLIAQKRGAVAVIVVNTKGRPMIAALAGLVGKPVLDIPVVLVDDDDGRVKSSAGRAEVVAESVRDEKLKFHVSMFCDSRWDDSQFGKPCYVGDQVVVRREGEAVDLPGTITERVNFGWFKVHVPGILVEEYPGWSVYRDSGSPCTAQAGSFIAGVTRPGTCEIGLKIHSAILCKDRKFRGVDKIERNIYCEQQQTVDL